MNNNNKNEKSSIEYATSNGQVIDLISGQCTRDVSDESISQMQKCKCKIISWKVL